MEFIFNFENFNNRKLKITKNEDNLIIDGEEIDVDTALLISRASEIIGKDLSVHEKDRKTVIKEITDFIERNIDNKNLSHDIDVLTDINKILKNKIK